MFENKNCIYLNKSKLMSMYVSQGRQRYGKPLNFSEGTRETDEN